MFHAGARDRLGKIFITVSIHFMLISLMDFLDKVRIELQGLGGYKFAWPKQHPDIRHYKSAIYSVFDNI